MERDNVEVWKGNYLRRIKNGALLIHKKRVTFLDEV
jgi:hypothetical protein